MRDEENGGRRTMRLSEVEDGEVGRRRTSPFSAMSPVLGFVDFPSILSIAYAYITTLRMYAGAVRPLVTEKQLVYIPRAGVSGSSPDSEPHSASYPDSYCQDFPRWKLACLPVLIVLNN